MGISPLLEGEEGDAQLSDARGDRKTSNLPENQVEYIKRLRGDHKKPLILVITGGGPVSLSGADPLRTQSCMLAIRAKREVTLWRMSSLATSTLQEDCL